MVSRPYNLIVSLASLLGRYCNLRNRARGSDNGVHSSVEDLHQLFRSKGYRLLRYLSLDYIEALQKDKLQYMPSHHL